MGLLGSATVGAEAFKPAEDRKSAAWILSAYDKLDGLDTSDLSKMKALLANRVTPDAAESAFSKLQACRTVMKYKSNPLELVAAEHYAFMRLEANKTGDTKLRGLPKKYHDMKVQLIKEGKQERLQTTDWPLAPPSEGTLAWADLGVEHGLADYRARENKGPSAGSRADDLESDMNLAVSSPFFAWIGRKFGTIFVRTGNENCRVREP